MALFAGLPLLLLLLLPSLLALYKGRGEAGQKRGKLERARGNGKGQSGAKQNPEETEEE